MIRLNYGYGYSKKYQDFVQQQHLQFQPKQNFTDRSKKLSIENKKRRRQFEERQRIHERNEQKRREEALNSRRRRQQEATNAYKAALSKELSKRNKTPISRTTSASSVASAVPCRPPYRSPTVDEVLSSIRGQGIGGSGSKPPKANYYSPKQPSKSYQSSDNSLEARLEMIYRSPPREANRCDTAATPSRHNSEPSLRSGDPLSRGTEYFASPSRGESSKARVDFSSYTEPRTYRNEVSTAPRPSAPAPPPEVPRREEPPKREDLRRSNSYDYLRDSLETMPEPTAKDEDRIRVQIDLTKFEQLDVSDCESIEADAPSHPPPPPPALPKPSEPIMSRQFFDGSSASDLTGQGSNYTIHSGEEESQIIARNDVEAIKVAASRTTHAWAEESAREEAERKKPIKSLIKRTPSAKRKQVRWDSVSALDDHTMEIDQFDISAEGEAVFTCQYTHSRPTSAAASYHHHGDSNNHLSSSSSPPTFDPHRTPTDAEINALWNKVRTTLHRNQAWEGAGGRPQMAPRDVPQPRSYDNHNRNLRLGGARAIQVTGQPVLSRPESYGEQHPGSLSMEEQRILQSLERLDAKLKTTDSKNYYTEFRGGRIRNR